MLAVRAAMTAERSRGLAAGSGSSERAATVNSRISLVNALVRFASCAPLRYMMFLNWERPAIGTERCALANGVGSFPASTTSRMSAEHRGEILGGESLPADPSGWVLTATWAFAPAPFWEPFAAASCSGECNLLLSQMHRQRTAVKLRLKILAAAGITATFNPPRYSFASTLCC